MKFNDAIIYIGKSFGSHRINYRRKEHLRMLKNNYHPNDILQSLYDTYGESRIVYQVIEEFEKITDEELLKKEIYYIKEFDTYNSGANKTIGGNTVTGMKHSEDTKRATSERTKGVNNPFYGKKHTEESLEKMSNFQKGKEINDNQRKGLSAQWQKGVPKSESHRKNISKGLKGRTYSEETLKKMSEAKKGKKMTKDSIEKRVESIRMFPDNIILEIFIKSNLTKLTNKELSLQYNCGKTLISNVKNLHRKIFRNAIENNLEELFEMTKKLIKFEKDGCTPCQMMQNILNERGVSILSYQVFDEPELASKYDVGSVPTLILVDESDNEIARTVGFKPNEIESIIEQL